MTSIRKPLGPPRKNQGIDKVLFLVIIALTVIGIFIVYSASSARSMDLHQGNPQAMFFRHLSFAITGMAAMLIVSLIPFNFWRTFALPALIISFALIILVFIEPIGITRKGATRWLNLGGFIFQPSEVAKFGLILFISFYASRLGGRMRLLVPGLLIPILVTMAIVVPIIFQPDFSTALMITAVVMGVLFFAGAHAGYFIAGSALFAGAGAIVVFSSAYRLKRILTFFAPNADPVNAGYQIRQSWLGMGRGGFFGVGLGESRQKLLFLPDAHTDFIYSVVGEELGFIGTAIVLGLFILLIWRGFRIALNCPDAFGGYLAAGITLSVGLYAMLNMAIATGVLPTTGLPLPFISYGGTSMLLTFAAMGIVLNISQFNWPQSPRNKVRTAK